MKSKKTSATGLTVRQMEVLEPLGPRTRGGASYHVYRSGSGSVWLLPSGRAGRRAAGALYSPQSFRGGLLRFAMRAGVPFDRLRLDQESVQELSRLAAGEFGTRDPTLGFLIGPPRKARRMTVVAMDEDARPAGYLKMAAHSAGRDRLAHEADTLRRLVRTRVADRVPRVLGTFDWRGAFVVAMSAGPVSDGPGCPGREHTEFLDALATENANGLSLHATTTGRSVVEELEHRRLDLDPPWYGLLERTFDRLDGTFGDSVLPTTLAHGDFVPWNTRQDADGLWVFDWEAAREAELPLIDAFHFTFVASVLTGRSEDQNWVADVARRLQPALVDRLAELRLAYLSGITLQIARDLRRDEYFGNPILARARRDMERSLTRMAG